MTESVRRAWIGRALAAVVAVSAAVALVGLTTGAWAAVAFVGPDSHNGAAPAEYLRLEMHPDGRLDVHYDDPDLRELYDAGKNKGYREALRHAVPDVLDHFAIACVVAAGLLAVAGVFRRLPAYLWAVGCAVVMGALTAVAVLRFETVSALATYTDQMNLSATVQAQLPWAGRTTTALVVALVAAAACAHPLLHDTPGKLEP
ncbi:hypothetical protein ACQP00_30345 [Dactylosporangium sp. CS-047395]|uniref:hypothetical protein n=1 Tax=Dactylosporangium sp. CS-047395 TaxID=3239936 RepID=UPI003D93E98F